MAESATLEGPGDPNSAPPEANRATNSTGEAPAGTELVLPEVDDGAGALALRERVEEAHARSAEYATKSRSSATQRAYRIKLEDFAAWCAELGTSPMPTTADALRLYFTERAEQWSVSSLAQARAAISKAHKLVGYGERFRGLFDEPQLAATWEGILREKGTRPDRCTPITIPELSAMVTTCDLNEKKGVRDRAILCFGLVGGFRRSELAALEVRDLSFVEAGILVTVRRSKADQRGEGAEVGIPLASNGMLCPVRALRTWMKAAVLEEGRVFRAVDQWGNVKKSLSTVGINNVIKRAALAAGLDPKKFSAHSLRAGMATSAALSGKDLLAIQRQGRWKTTSMVQVYARPASAFQGNAMDGVL